MASRQSRRDLLRLILGGGVLGFCRALFGAAVPRVQAVAAVPATVVPPVTACPAGELASVATYVYDARGRVCMTSRWRNPPLVRAFTYKVEAPRTDPTPRLPPPAEDPRGGNEQV